MKVIPIGCSGSFPGPGSPASCYLVQAEHRGRLWSIVLDLGSGSLGPLHQHLDPCALDAVVLTHLHPDHCLDLAGLYVMCTYRPEGPLPRLLPVWGPPGTAERMARAYGVTEPHPLDDRFRFEQLTEGERLAIGPFTVTPYLMNHPVETYGLRVEAHGKTLAYTGDTDDCPNLRPLFAEADLVLADCAFVEGRDTARGIHLTGARAARAVAEAGGVRRLLLTHIPSWNDPLECRAQATGAWPGPVEIIRPGHRYEL